MKHLSTTLMILAVQCISSANVMCSEHHSRHWNRSSHTHGVSQIQERALERHLSDEQESLTEGQESLQGKQGQLTTNRSKHKQQNKDIGMSSSSRMRSRHHEKQVMTITDEELEKVTRSSKHSDKDKIEHAPRRPTSNKNRQSGQHNKLVITNVPVHSSKNLSSPYVSSSDGESNKEDEKGSFFNGICVNLCYLLRTGRIYLDKYRDVNKEKAKDVNSMIRKIDRNFDNIIRLENNLDNAKKVLMRKDILDIGGIHNLHKQCLRQKKASQDLIYAYSNMVQDELRVFNKVCLSYQTYNGVEDVQGELLNCINSMFGVGVKLNTVCETWRSILNSIEQDIVNYYDALCSFTNFYEIDTKIRANDITLGDAIDAIQQKMKEGIKPHFISRMYYTMLDIGNQILASNKNKESSNQDEDKSKESSDQKKESVDQNKNVKCAIIGLPYIMRDENSDYYGVHHVLLSLNQEGYSWNDVIACTNAFLDGCKSKINAVVAKHNKDINKQLVKFLVQKPLYGPSFEYNWRQDWCVRKLIEKLV